MPASGIGRSCRSPTGSSARWRPSAFCSARLSSSAWSLPRWITACRRAASSRCSCKPASTADSTRPRMRRRAHARCSNSAASRGKRAVGDDSNEVLDARGRELMATLHGERGQEGYAAPGNTITGELYPAAIRYGYGELWFRPGLTHRQRMLCALASFTVLGLERQLREIRCVGAQCRSDAAGDRRSRHSDRTVRRIPEGTQWTGHPQRGALAFVAAEPIFGVRIDTSAASHDDLSSETYVMTSKALAPRQLGTTAVNTSALGFGGAPIGGFRFALVSSRAPTQSARLTMPASDISIRLPITVTVAANCSTATL